MGARPARGAAGTIRPAILSMMLAATATETAAADQPGAAFGDGATCSAELGAREAAFAETGVDRGPGRRALDRLLEANRAQCEIVRIRGEVARLQTSQERLRGEIDRLEALWAAANKANPVRFADFPGRDRSQRVMREDVSAMSRDVEALEAVIADLSTLVARGLELARLEFADLDQGGAERLLSAFRDDPQADALRRALTRPPSS